MPYREHSKCPYCNDTGMKFHETSSDIGVGALPCICVNALTINKILPLLNTVSDPPIEDILEIGKKYKILRRDSTYKFKSCIFFGNEKRFLYLFKSICVGYYNYTSKFELLDGLQVVHKYHVEQQEGIDRDIYTLINFDLLGLTFNNETENKAIDKTVHDTIQNRIRYDKGTWIYANSFMELRKNKGCSESTLEILTNNRLFEVFDLGDLKSFNYNGFEDLDAQNRRQTSDANRAAAKMFS